MPSRNDPHAALDTGIAEAMSDLSSVKALHRCLLLEALPPAPPSPSHSQSQSSLGLPLISGAAAPPDDRISSAGSRRTSRSASSVNTSSTVSRESLRDRKLAALHKVRRRAETLSRLNAACLTPSSSLSEGLTLTPSPSDGGGSSSTATPPPHADPHSPALPQAGRRLSRRRAAAASGPPRYSAAVADARPMLPFYRAAHGLIEERLDRPSSPPEMLPAAAGGCGVTLGDVVAAVCGGGGGSEGVPPSPSLRSVTSHATMQSLASTAYLGRRSRGAEVRGARGRCGVSRRRGAAEVWAEVALAGLSGALFGVLCDRIVQKQAPPSPSGVRRALGPELGTLQRVVASSNSTYRSVQATVVGDFLSALTPQALFRFYMKNHLRRVRRVQQTVKGFLLIRAARKELWVRQARRCFERHERAAVEANDRVLAQCRQVHCERQGSLAVDGGAVHHNAALLHALQHVPRISDADMAQRVDAVYARKRAAFLAEHRAYEAELCRLQGERARLQRIGLGAAQWGAEEEEGEGGAGVPQAPVFPVVLPSGDVEALVAAAVQRSRDDFTCRVQGSLEAQCAAHEGRKAR